MLITAVVGTGLYGYYVDDPAARRDALTGVEAAGLAVAINEVVDARRAGCVLFKRTAPLRSLLEESRSPPRMR
jgi:hypothetical protein